MPCQIRFQKPVQKIHHKKIDGIAGHLLHAVHKRRHPVDEMAFGKIQLSKLIRGCPLPAFRFPETEKVHVWEKIKLDTRTGDYVSRVKD